MKKQFTFTLDELDMLANALDALESSSSKDDLLGLMLTGLTAKSKEEMDAVVDARISEIDEKKIQRAQRSEDILMLKAKIIGMRRGRRLDDMTADIESALNSV